MENNFDFGDIFNKTEKDIGRTNIVLAGKTGVGKSTLINSIFSEPLAETGVGRPVTQNIKEYTKEKYPISLFDTKGFELSNYRSIVADLKQEINNRKGVDPSTHIHLAWFCISDEGKRIEDAEIEFINELSDSIPVVVVLTKSIDSDLSFYNDVKQRAYSAKQVLRTLALPYDTPIGKIPSFGLENLADVTAQLIPESQRDAFVAAQKVSRKLQIDRARNVVKVAAGSAMAAGAVPIPFSDAAVLAPIQVGMLAMISRVMGIDLTKSFLMTLVSSAAGVIGATYAGRAIVSGLLKLIPLAGSIIGGAISAATAGTLTALMGEAYIQAILALQDKNEPITPQSLSGVFVEKLKLKK